MMLRPIDILPRESIISESLAPSSHVKEFLEEFGHEIRNRLEQIRSELVNNIPNLLDSNKSSQVVNNINQQLNNTNNLLKNLTLYKEFINPEEYQAILGTAKLIPITINIVSTIPMIPVMLKGDSGSKQISNFLQDLQDKINEVEKIINSHSSNLWDQNSTHELFSIIEQVGSILRTDQDTIDSVKELTKNILLEQNPLEFLVTLASSASELLNGLYKIKSSVEHDSTYIDLIKKSIEKLPFLKGDTTNYILQLACELLKAGDIQGALDIFKSSPEPELSLQPTYQFNMALALTETKSEDNLREAAEILNRIKSNATISKDKINLLQMTIADNLDEYGKAEEYYSSISKDYIPATYFENLLLLKYRYKYSIDETSEKLGMFINKNEEGIKKLLNDTNNLDLWYLTGEGYKAQGEYENAVDCYKKVIIAKAENQSSYFADSTYPVFCMLLSAVQNRNIDLVNDILNPKTYNVDESNEVKTEVLFQLIKLRDLNSIKFLVDGVEDINFTGKGGVTALHMACGTNNIDIVKYFLSKSLDLNAKNILDFTPIESAALRVASEDGDENILKILLEEYRDTQVNISDEILLSVGLRLQHGPDWIEQQYQEYVHEILGKNIDWSANDYENSSW